jgi:uncharacterized coiled-coil DUF342 family protein
LHAEDAMATEGGWDSGLAPDLPDSNWDVPSGDWGASSVPADGWGEVDPAIAEAKAAVAAVVKDSAPRPPRPPPRRDDDEKVAKEVENICTQVIAGKKKMAALRAKMDENDVERQAIHTKIGLVMPGLQEARAQKAALMGQLQEARLPQIWMDRARELNVRRKALPGGCTTVLELNRAIKETEREIDHGSLNLKQEKAALERIRELKRGKPTVAAYEADQALIEQVRNEHKAVQQDLKPVNASFDELKATASEKAEAMDKLTAANTALRATREGLNTAVAELKTNLDSQFAKV